MSDAVHRYLLAYDVGSDIRRTRVAKLLEAHGDRIQYSVFVVDTRPAKMLRLKVNVVARLHLDTDSLLICDLGPLGDESRRRLERVGARRVLTGDSALII
ncbi:CRISPR-associated endonuclease Cas2 [Pseudonocardia sp. C8]|uniref:CRISPR-associated endonuclease Cas2 n=1 Tax=Pseudonocardia sp. C8 TaxID=2762759 RepID=UPI00164262DC|nr:CRISPR-associated endonuclease Cas2 [Pseudonocardia sp. C8]MBC3189993.1 CRISPR-associated endonuclease Cas2 [Pseudonocardia sp. C8]